MYQKIKSIRLPVEYYEEICRTMNCYKCKYSNKPMTDPCGWIANAVGPIINICNHAKGDGEDTIELSYDYTQYLRTAVKTIADELCEQLADINKLADCIEERMK